MLGNITAPSILPSTQINDPVRANSDYESSGAEGHLFKILFLFEFGLSFGFIAASVCPRLLFCLHCGVRCCLCVCVFVLLNF